jgi:hypothetical protein
MPMPRWKHTLDIKAVWEDEEMPLPEKGKAICEKIKAAPFYPGPDGDDLEMIVEELEDAAKEDDVDWFDQVWSAFYDWADANRVWVKTAF